MAKIKTCIVCGGAAGSKEHVFPASLGGRRKNSGIYCKKHDNSYSGLVGELSSQVDFLNAYLGVRSDHTKKKKVTYERDPKSGAEIAISADGIRFTEARTISETRTDDGISVWMAFPDRQSANQWIEEQEASGRAVSFQGKPTEGHYFLETIHHHRSFGGRCGLGAMAYVMQTFFAQAFPEIARSEALVDFIAFTQAIAEVAILGACEDDDSESVLVADARAALATALQPFGGELPVWWDFDVLPMSSPNAFRFGHRVTVGVDGSDGQIYGRISLFSTLNFAACLGRSVPGNPSREVTIDIDPLAEHPPNDVNESEAPNAASRVDVPRDVSEGLARAIGDGTQQRLFADLHRRLEDYQLTQLAQRMGVALASGVGLADYDRFSLIARIVDEHSQQVWRIVSHVMRGMAAHFRQNGMDQVAKVVDLLVATDGGSLSGLSTSAQMCLELGKGALVAQMDEDCVHGLLSEGRIADLMGRGPGMFLVGKFISAPLLDHVSKMS